jgi:GNAT superfamily N-acetyltransferase
MIRFRLVDPSEYRLVFQWHSGFAAANDALFPQPVAVFKQMVEDRQLWCAEDAASGEYLGLAYAYFDSDQNCWEIGGLMVAAKSRGTGIGSTIMRLALGHLLFEEDPIDRGQDVIAHVLEGNRDPRAIIEECLRFRRSKSVVVPGSKLPGLRVNEEGNVVGDEFAMDRKETLVALASWCGRWSGKMKDGTSASIDFMEGISLAEWERALSERAGKA